MGRIKRKRGISDANLQKNYWTVGQVMKMTGATEMQIQRCISKSGIKAVHRKKITYIPRRPFQKWISGQPHYLLREESEITAMLQSSMSVTELAEILDVDDQTAWNIVRSKAGREFLRTFWIANRMRIEKTSFFRWLSKDSRYGLAGTDRTDGDVEDLDSMSAEKYLTDAEAARVAGLSVSRLAYFRRKGEFPSERLTYHVVRIPASGFLPWLQERKKAETEERSRRGRFQRIVQENNEETK